MTRVQRKGTGKSGDVLDDTGEIIRWSTTGLQFYRQVAIDRFIVDFFCPRKRIVVEVDGGVHDEEDTEEHDEVRDEFLIKQKDVKQIVRVTNDEVMKDLTGVLEKIARACGARSAPSPGPSPHRGNTD